MAKASSFIPKKGINKALSELRGTKAFAQSAAQNSKAVKEGLESVRKEMADNASKALPIQDIINKKTGVAKPRKNNGRADIKSAKESAHVFNQSFSNKNKAIKQDISDINNNGDKIANAIGQMRENRLANEMAESYRGNGNKANRRIEEMRINSKQNHDAKIKSLEKQLDAAANAENLDKMVEIQSMIDNLGQYQAPNKKTFHERKAERVKGQMSQQQQKELEDMISGFGDIDHSGGPSKKKAASQQTEASPSGGNQSILQQAQDRVKGNNFVYNMAALGVGGGLVLNMANNKGQQSNAQLYGQY